MVDPVGSNRKLVIVLTLRIKSRLKALVCHLRLLNNQCQLYLIIKIMYLTHDKNAIIRVKVNECNTFLYNIAQ